MQDTVAGTYKQNTDVLVSWLADNAKIPEWLPRTLGEEGLRAGWGFRSPTRALRQDLGKGEGHPPAAYAFRAKSFQRPRELDAAPNFSEKVNRFEFLKTYQTSSELGQDTPDDDCRSPSTESTSRQVPTKPRGRGRKRERPGAWAGYCDGMYDPVAVDLLGDVGAEVGAVYSEHGGADDMIRQVVREFTRTLSRKLGQDRDEDSNPVEVDEDTA
ncbi:hypothetical protein DL766_005728 [Monosporascus sp. MC13-8B]|nr:hypothetical protein DL763_002858 [Monosporascus cannonballus]RYP28712.1 hypothetical protein DL766_005728 [Monosporascus sp. MC13-8B]